MAFKDVRNMQRGFTLIEVLVTMVIVSVGLLAMGQLLITTIVQNANSEKRMDAAAVVKNLISEAATTVTSDAACAAVAANAAADARSYLGNDYVETVTCTRLAEESYLIAARVTTITGAVVVENELIYTTFTGK